jgi:hypothetical protein
MARTLSRDTTPEAEAVQLAALREMPPWRKLQLVEESCRAAIAMTEAGIRARHPEASEDEVRHRLRVAILGESLAEAAYDRPAGMS